MLVLLATATTTALVAQIAIHRRVFRWRRKGRLVTAGHAMARVVLDLVSLLFAEVATFVFDVVVGRAAALALGGAMALLVLGSLVVLPFVVGGRPPQSGT